MIIRVVFREPAAITIIPGPGPRVRNLPGHQRVLIFYRSQHRLFTGYLSHRGFR